MTYIEIWVFKRIHSIIPFFFILTTSCSEGSDFQESVLEVDRSSEDTLVTDSSQMKIEQVFHPNLINLLDSLIDWQETEELEAHTNRYSEIMCMYFYKKEDKYQFIINSTQDYEYEGPTSWIEYRDYLLVYFDFGYGCGEDLINFSKLDTSKPDRKYFYNAGLNYNGFEFIYNIDSLNNLKFSEPQKWLEYQLNQE